MNGYDRSLTRADIMEEMGFNASEAKAFMQKFGHRDGYGKARKIGWRELMFLQLDGTLAAWVKENCKPERQTVRARRQMDEA
ncbi:MAG: hypothetical protein K5663_11265 [Clostridiales bacterium]|nr:hypothetical protein [Clostridiales bacterium]